MSDSEGKRYSFVTLALDHNDRQILRELAAKNKTTTAGLVKKWIKEKTNNLKEKK